MHEFDNTAFSREAESEYPSPGGVFSEAQEVQLAEQLLELENEQQLEQFLGDLISKAGSAIGSLIKSPVGQALGGALKSVAGKVLPMAGQAIGGMFGPAGAQIGGQLASAAGSAFGLNEMEAGEQEYEAAQTFVRMAADAVKNAASAPPGMNPYAVAQAAVAQAAQTHAPALLGLSAMGGQGVSGGGQFGQGSPIGQGGSEAFGGFRGQAGPMGPGAHGGAFSRGRSGHWERRGNTIILHGA